MTESLKEKQKYCGYWKNIFDNLTECTRIANKVLKKKSIKVGIKTKIMFMLMRMMQKANLGSGDADRAYWEKWLVSSGKTLEVNTW